MASELATAAVFVRFSCTKVSQKPPTVITRPAIEIKKPNPPMSAELSLLNKGPSTQEMFTVFTVLSKTHP
jgi:hypothetical protein